MVEDSLKTVFALSKVHVNTRYYITIYKKNVLECF